MLTGADVPGSLLRTDENAEGISGGAGEHIQRLAVVSAVL
jgi:hypothetical protein